MPPNRAAHTRGHEMRNSIISLPLMLALAGAAQAEYTLGPANNYPVDGWVWRVAVGDVTGDRRDDVIAVRSSNSDGMKLFVYAQKEDGGLTAPRIYPLPSSSMGLTLGDLNSDGI